MSIFQNTMLAGSATQIVIGYDIDQSIRFNDDDEAHLYDTSFSASPTSSTDCTISVWVKRGSNLGSNSVIIYGGDPNGSTAESLRFGTGNQLQFSQASSDYDLKTTQLFRDVGAWYHIVAVLNTDAAESSRAALYVNGSKVTDFATENYPSSSYSTNFTSGASGVVHTVGANSYESVGPDSQHFDGYLAEINFIDGQVLTPTSFGEFNSDTGQWTPKKYTGSYGTNGFYLKGEDSSDLGNDSSGNGNDFTSSGLAANDQVTDSPTSNHCTLNPLITPATMTFTNGNLALSGYTASTSAYGTFGLSSGKWFWQIVAQANAMAGISATPNGSQYPGQASDSYAMDLTNGTKYNNGSSASYGSGEISAGDVIGVGFDADAGTLKFYDSDGNDIGTAYSSLTSGPYFPVFRNGNSANISVNFGQTGAFTFTPSGYNSLTVLNLPDPTIADPSAHFQSVQYSTTTSAQDITFGGNSDLAPDWLWFKRRDHASDHFLFDKVRGVLKTLSSNDTTVEETSAGSLTAFGSDGFSLGDGGSNNDINGASSSGNFMAWGWRAGGTSGSSNSDGSITSTVSVNTTAGFSIVKFVGNATVGATVGHGLGVAPKMLVVKPMDAVEGWSVYHASLGNTKGSYWNISNTPYTGDYYWNDTSPSSTVFTLHDHVLNNGSGNNMIAYCFAEVPGYSKISSYTGNGSTDGQFIFTGFKPAYVRIKRTDAAASWEIADNIRDPFNPVTSILQADTVDAEWTATSKLFDFVSNGFKHRSSHADFNASGGTYIYTAFAETPFKTANAR